MYLQKIKDFLKQEKKEIMLSIVLGLVFTLAVVVVESFEYSVNTQKNIADNLVRFHVRANTNTSEDQTLKILVKDKVLEKIGSQLSDSSSKEETLEYLEDHLPSIQEFAEQEIHAQGYNYPVKVAIMKDYFPTKVYGDIALPTGEYDTLRIDIGTAQGDNWWCVMFPPLCFVDITQEKLTDSSKNKFKSILPEDEYNLISKYQEGDEIPIKVKFKIIEWWQKNLKEPIYAKVNGTAR